MELLLDLSMLPVPKPLDYVEPVEIEPLLYPIRIPASEIVEAGSPCPLGQGSSPTCMNPERHWFRARTFCLLGLKTLPTTHIGTSISRDILKNRRCF